MTDVDALTAFIRARLDDEERDAKAAERESGSSWRFIALRAAVRGEDGEDLGTFKADVGAHIARQDPAATLARVAALRALVDRATTDLNHLINVFRDEYIDGIEEARAEVLRDLAGIWADHPGYRTQWKP